MHNKIQRYKHVYKDSVKTSQKTQNRKTKPFTPPLCIKGFLSFQNAVTFSGSSGISLLSFRGRSLSPSLISILFLFPNIWETSRKVFFLVSGTTTQT